jgi:hypothetical protein
METRKSKRSLRLALVMGAAVAGTALVGWGGLAAWQAYTQNAGNAFAVGTLSHTNAANLGTACDSTLSSATPGACSVIVTDSALTSDFTGTHGTVTITNTGSLSSTFSMSMATPGTSALCADLTLAVSDANGYYYGAAGDGVALTEAMSPTQLNNSAKSSTWAQNDTNTFTFTIGVSGNYSTDTSVLGTSCSFTILFTQASA